MRRGSCARVFSTLCALVLFTCAWANSVEARGDWRWQNTYTLRGSINLSYQSKFGDGEGDSFGQTYGVGFSGFVLDRRLMTFGMGGFWTDASGDGDFADSEKSIWGFNVQTSFFNRIDRNRGLKLWKYVPSPFILSYDYRDYNDTTSSTFRASAYYSRPGWVRFFHNKRWIYYDDGRTRGNVNKNRNANRYRTKYNNNWNRNGAGNWNRNGAGNWNRNGAGNWNAGGNGNGNGNWNRNGNGNWNRNGNGNWNRNGNGNWNAGGNGNWNAGGNGNWTFNRNQFEPERPWGFKFPNMSFFFLRSSAENDEGTFTDTLASFRANTSNSLMIRGHRYSSSYWLTYNFTGSDGRHSQAIGFRAGNRWHRYYFATSLSYRTEPDVDTYRGRMDVSTSDTFWRNVRYSVSVFGEYESSTPGSSTDDYGAALTLKKFHRYQRRLSPDMRTDARLSATVDASIDKDDDDYAFSLGGTQSVFFEHIKRFLVSAAVSSAIEGSKNSEDFTVPIFFILNGQSRGFRKLSFGTRYQFSTAVLDDEDAMDHTLRGTVSYRIARSMKVGGLGSYTLTMKEGDTSDSSFLRAHYDWAVGPRAHFRSGFNAGFADGRNSYEASANWRQQVSWRSSLTVGYSRDWDNIDDGALDIAEAHYTWRFGKFSLLARYRYENTRSDEMEQSIYVNVKRTFARSFRTLF
jgi:hypothetical protein